MNDSLKMILAKARQALMSENYDLSLKQCQLAISLNPGAIEAYTMAGTVCMIKSNYTDAEKYYSNALNLDASNGELYFMLGNAFFSQKKFTQMTSCYAKAIQFGCSDESKRKLHYVMGIINQHNDEYKEALINYEKSEQFGVVDDDYADILLNRVEIYVAQGNWEDAENCAMQLKLLIPGEFKSYQLLFQIMLQQNKIEQALDILAEGEKYCEATKENQIEFVFDHAMVHCFLAEQFPDEMKKHFADASIWLDKLNEMDVPENVAIEAELTRADMQLKMRNRKAAMDIAEKIAELDKPDLKEYIEKAQFIMVDCCRNEGDYQKVRHYATKLKGSENILYKHHGYYSEFWSVNEMAKQDETLKKKASDLYDRAIAHYKQSSAQNPGDFLTYVFRAQTYAEVGNFEQAEKICEMLPSEAKDTLKKHIDQCRKSLN